MANETRRKEVVPLLNKLWPWYKWTIHLPAGQEAQYKVAGVALYAGVLTMAIVLVVVMFGGPPSTYIDYKSTIGDSKEAPLHRLPDIIACPMRVEGVKRKFSVQYHLRLLDVAKISEPHLEELTQMYYDGCDAEKCPQIPGECAGTKFERYCERVKDYLYKHQMNASYIPLVSRQHRLYVLAQGKEHGLEIHHWLSLFSESKARGGRWTLDMLWAALRFDHSASATYYQLKHRNTTRLGLGEMYPGLKCFYYKSNPLTGRMQRDDAVNYLSWSNDRDVWVGKSLCQVNLGSILPKTKSPFFGCAYLTHSRARKGTNPLPKFWLGSLENTPLDEKAFIASTNRVRGKPTAYVFPPIVSGIIHYKVTKIIDETKKVKKCVEQPLLRGLTPPCVQEKGGTVDWFVDLVPQARLITTMWIYPKTFTTITKKPTFTQYTRFQFGIGLFGCCVGFSFMQLFHLLVLFLTKLWARLKKHFQVCETVLSILMAVVAVGLTVYDVAYYMQNRYTVVFAERDADLKIPMVKICTTSSDYVWSFINTTALYHHNVSLQLYGYLKFAGWLRVPEVHAPRRLFQINGTNYAEYPEWTRRNFIPKVEPIEKCRPSNSWKESFVCGYHNRFPLFGHIVEQHYSPDLRPDAAASRKFFQPLHEELARLGERLGLGPRPSIRELTVKFGLDPRKIFRSCWIGTKEIEDCGQYATYTAKTSLSLCLALKIPQRVLGGSSMAAGHEHGLKIVVDREVYARDSDFRSYYGPNTEERHLHPTDQYCVSGSTQQIPLSDPKFERSQCGRKNSWGLIVQHPVWGVAETSMSVLNAAIWKLPSIEAEMRVSFSEGGDTTQCWPVTEEATCTRPKEDATSVLRALAMVQKCGCAACFGHLAPKFFENLAWILERNGTQCCTGREYYDCYFTFMERVDWIKQAEAYRKAPTKNGFTNWKKELEKDLSMKEFLNFNDDILFMSDVKQLEKADSKFVTKAITSIKVENYFPERLLKRTAKFLRDCFKPICDRDSLELASLQTTHYDSDRSAEAKLSVFYGSKRALGTEKQDLFSPFQMMATLLNSLSFTLGVSLVGVVELVLLLVQKLRHAESQGIGRVLKDHLMQGVAVIVPGSDGVAPTSTSIEENRPRGRTTTGVGPTAQVDNERNSTVSLGTFASEVPNPPESNAPRNGRGAETREERRTKVFALRSDEAQSGKLGQALSIVLILFVVATLATLITFLATLTNSELTCDMAVQPFYRRPTIVLCAQTAADFADFRRELKRSHCQVTEKAVSCEKVFATYMRNKENRFCLVQDNSRVFHKLDSKVFDLVLTVPSTMPPLSVLATGTNKTSIQDIYPFKMWEEGKDMIVQYSVRLRSSETGRCTAELPSKPCEICPAKPEERPPTHVCCMEKEELEPGLVEGDTCHRYEFSPGASSQPAKEGPAWRKLSVLVASENILVFMETGKYHWIEILSVLGGFCGSFVELTVLSVACAAIFGIAKLFTPQKT